MLRQAGPSAGFTSLSLATVAAHAPDQTTSHNHNSPSPTSPTRCSAGTDAEMVFPGGEAAFVRQMVADSAALRGAVHWYTSMVGKKATLAAIKQLAWQRGATAVRTTELSQGECCATRAAHVPSGLLAFACTPQLTSNSCVELVLCTSFMLPRGSLVLKVMAKASCRREDGTLGNRMVVRGEASCSRCWTHRSRSSC